MRAAPAPRAGGPGLHNLTAAHYQLFSTRGSRMSQNLVKPLPGPVFAQAVDFIPIRSICHNHPGQNATLEVELRNRAHSIPSSFASAFHLLSTSDLVFSSIRISSGQDRLKPSLDHLRVASIPILEP